MANSTSLRGARSVRVIAVLTSLAAIYFARAILVPSSHRPVDESEGYLLCEGRESGTKEMEGACGLGDQRTEFRICRMVSVGLIEDLHPGGGPLDQSNLRESLQLPLHGSHTRADLSRNLASKKGLVWHTEEERQNAASGLSEEEVSQGIRLCSHNENNCTRFENSQLAWCHLRRNSILSQ